MVEQETLSMEKWSFKTFINGQKGSYKFGKEAYANKIKAMKAHIKQLRKELKAVQKLVKPSMTQLDYAKYIQSQREYALKNNMKFEEPPDCPASARAVLL